MVIGDSALAPPASRLRATLIGGLAVLLWSALALLTTATAPVPPFQLVALTFGIAFLLALGKWCWQAARGGPPPLSHLKQPPAVWLLGVLIAYLWPLFIVLGSALLPGERLRWWHGAGALAGLAGAALLVTRNGGLTVDPRYATGYLAALGCAFTWSAYSLLSRRFGAVSSDAVGGFCGVTALLGLACHLALETTAWPAGAGGWLAVLALGLGPVGAAFFVWDHGVKHGDIRTLGAMAYGGPLLSTLLLVLAGRAAASPVIALACALIVGGAVLASRDLWGRRT